MSTRRFACALFLNVFVLAGTMFPEDKQPPAPRDHGWGRGEFYLGMGSSSRRKSEIEKIEKEMNDAIASVPGIIPQEITIRVVFGRSSDKDAEFRLWYKYDANKERKPPKVKLFDVLNFSSDSLRAANCAEEAKWCAENQDINIISTGDWGYDARRITVIIYDPAP